jgi:hypothetical protein
MPLDGDFDVDSDGGENLDRESEQRVGPILFGSDPDLVETLADASAAKQERYAVIRRDFDAGMSERAIERKHHVGRRTIIKALNSADPPARKKIHREPAALNGLHPHIDAMIDADPAIATATIWQRLADDHGTTVAYPTLRTYVVGRRSAPTS